VNVTVYPTIFGYSRRMHQYSPLVVYFVAREMFLHKKFPVHFTQLHKNIVQIWDMEYSNESIARAIELGFIYVNRNKISICNFRKILSHFRVSQNDKMPSAIVELKQLRDN
jgi:hypothetical protein